MHPSRRRKKRPNYGIRTVEVTRGPNGFGFTISGQQPCILSCIVKDSPADLAGLRAGDFLISVNDVSVSKTTHDAVVNLIGSCVAPIKMTIAENYYSDSSDEGFDVHRIITCRKPKHKPRPNKTHRPVNRKSNDGLPLKNVNHNGVMKYSTCNNETAVSIRNFEEVDEQSNSRDYKAFMGYLGAIETPNQFSSDGHLNGLSMEDQGGPIEYKALVGYLGTIEMPEQLSPETRLQTVCNCIRKLRQEKRSPTAVLMTILPTCLTLKNSSNHILAIYPTNRVVYVGSARDKDSRYFGLVTSAITDANINQNFDDWHSELHKMSNSELDISNSCHIFVTDPKLIDHCVHSRKAEAFNIACTLDPISGRCLEFPKDSLYIVSLIQSMYKLQCDVQSPKFNIDNGSVPMLANSPQPSASSNSDSGIGFRDDFNSISDRIVLVEFPERRFENAGKHNNFIAELKVDARENMPRSTGIYFHSSDSKPDALLKVVLNNEKPMNNLPNMKSYEGVSIKNSFGDLKVENTKNSNRVEENLNNFSYAEKQNCRSSFDKLARNVSLSSFTSSDDNTRTNEPCTQSCKDPDFIEPEQNPFDQCNMNTYQERPIDVPYEMEIEEFKRSADDLSTCSGRSHEPENSVFKIPNAAFFDRKSKQTQKLASSCDELNRCGNNKRKSTQKNCGTSKPNYSYEELNNMDFGQQLGYGSLNDLFFSHLGKDIERRQIARSEPDVRLPSGNGISCFMNETDGQANKDVQESSVQVWTTSFEKLLEDAEGLKAFSEFLKKEFSSENIDFWIAVERFRHLPNGLEKRAEARRIYQQHICVGALEAVNVDSHGRQCVEQALHEATSNIFDQAQKQVLNLMKFDSYPRFLKSDVYKQCLVNSKKPNGVTPIKLKKSLSNAEDRRRKSLLPWHRKSRSKSKDRFENSDGLTIKGTDGSLKNEIHSSRSSLTSLDLAIANNMQNSKDDSELFTGNLLCRVSFGNCSTTVVQIKPSETINELVQRLLEKRGLNYTSFEVYTDKHTKPVDSNEPSSILASCEVKIQQRVVFKLDLPNRKTVSVKSKATKMIVDVLKPILHKYDFTLDQVIVINPKDGGTVVDVQSPITSIDNLRLQVQLIDKQTESVQEHKNDTSVSKNHKLVEITNQVFEGILHDKAENSHLKTKSDKGSVKSEDLGSEHSSSYFGKFLRRDSSNQEWKKKSLIPRSKILGSVIGKGQVTPDQSQMKNKPLIAKWKAGVNKLQVSPSSESECNELVEGLTRAQKARLEDQRGTEINFELPDFLKDKEDDRLRKSQNHSAESNFSDHHSSSDTQSKTMSELDNRVNYENQSILSDGRKKDDSPVNTPSKQMKLNNVKSFLPKFSAESNNFKSSQIGMQKTFESPLGKELKMEPPPLPPKPKIVPLKPPNWGQNDFRRPKEISQNIKNKQALFLEHPSSSFV